MSRTSKPTDSVVWLDVERAVEAFELARTRLGHADPVAFCPPPGDPLRVRVAAELVRADLEFAIREGRGRRLEDYRGAFPDLFKDLETLADVAFEEYRLRRQSGDPVSDDDYRQRFGIDPSSWPHGGGSSSSRRGRDLSSAGRFVGGRGSTAAAELFPEPGEHVVGFRLVRLLGRGAFGQVYLAEQADLAGRYVALKLSTQLVTEAGTLARLQHTNIVPVYSVHQVGAFHAICMPYLGSATLADVLQRLREGPTGTVAAGREHVAPRSDGHFDFPGPIRGLGQAAHVDACLWIAAELADGLAHAHDRGIVHRDLKPANVLISDEGRPMLLDFNLAGDSNRPGAEAAWIGGTLSHMAPEQLAAIAGEAAVIDARSDVFALGLILFELLTGHPPHPLPQGRSPEEFDRLRQARSSPVPSARRLNRAVTPAVEAILERALCPMPASRYQNARELGEDLRLQLANRPLRNVREPSVRERLTKAARRNPWIQSIPFVAGLLTLVAAIGFGGFAYRGRQLDLARAEVKLAAFRHKAEEARPLLMIPEPTNDDLAEGFSLGREALDVYGLFDADRWDESTSFRHRSPQERQSLRRELGELAYLMAGAAYRQAERRIGTDDSAASLASAFRLNDMAATLLERDPARRPYVLRQRARLLQASGREREAKSLRNAIQTEDQRSEVIWLNVADLNRRREVRRALDLLIAGEPEHGDSLGYWRIRAEHHAAVAEWPEAAAAFSTALALSPRPHADLLGRRGAARLALKQFEAARSDYDRAIELEPEVPALYRDRAQAKLGMGDFAGALADLDHAVELDPSHTRVYLMKSQIHARSGDREAARRNREEGLARTPSDELSWIARGLARRTRDPEGAIADFDQALLRDPESRQAMQNKASVLSEQLGRTEDAIAVLDRLVELHPEYVPARAGRGVLLARLGRREAAHADAAAALSLSDEPFTRYQVAGIFAQTSKQQPEDLGEALRLLASALRDKEGLSLLPNDPDLDPIRNVPSFAKLVDAARALESAAASSSQD